MTTRRRSFPLGLLAPILGLIAAAPAATPASPDAKAAEAPKFEAVARPIFKTHCFHCHGEEPGPKGGLDLRLARAVVRGGDSGPAVEPGRSAESLLWEKIEADEMPPGPKKLSPEEKQAIASWIDAGAKAARDEPESLPPGPVFTDEERGFWSFQPIRRPEVPTVRHAELVRNPIDAFLLAALEAKGASFSPEADRRTLIRRASFDLLGLPPTPEEVAAFEGDKAPDAYERLIDRLLASPHHGERWARHWLDVVGYADSDGDPTKDTVRPYAYKYRDYVIRALNADRPWDILIREQLAGDEMIVSSLENLDPADHDRLAATGFLRMAPDLTAEPGIDPAQSRNDVVAETIKVVSTSLLGLTVGCAQCHSHRYDPISHEDYYRFRALFEPAFDLGQWKVPARRLVSLWTPDDRRRAEEVDAQVKAVEVERKAKVDELVAKVLDLELAGLPEGLRPKLREARDTPREKRTDEQKALLKTHPRVLVTPGNVSLYDGKAFAEIMSAFAGRIAAVRATRPADDYVHALVEEPGRRPATHLFDRGDPGQPRQEVKPGELSILAQDGKGPAFAEAGSGASTTGRRLAYARHLTSGTHPLVPRVLVNRAWMNHFGRGIVATPGDFGRLGDRPSHPELLDWLADDFVRTGWRLKRLHRLVMTSTAYRQSSRRTPELDAIDPDNRLLGRMPVRRLEAEAVRDAILAVSGALNPAMFGPPLEVAPDEGGLVLIGKDTRDSAGRQTGPPGSLGEAEFRRSLYVQVRRSLPLGFTESFDVPTLSPNCERRETSTVAPQSLALMNSEFAVSQGLRAAARVAKAAGADPAARVRLAWRLALGRDADEEEVSDASAFLSEQAAEFASAPPPEAPKPAKGKGRGAAKADDAPKDPDLLALGTFFQALFGSNAFLYVD